jgi:predicted O-methyltransferase YrrM
VAEARFEFIEQSSPAYGPPAPVPIIQEEAEFSQLLGLYRERQPRRVLEVGTYAGGTLFHWLQNARPGALVVSLDLYEDKDNSDLYPRWTPPGVRCAVIRGDSRAEQTLAEARALGPYDWLFLDAGHKADEVRPDWANYRPLVAPGGLFCLHDVAVDPERLPTIQVAPLWQEIKRDYATLEFCEGGSGIGVVLL